MLKYTVVSRKNPANEDVKWYAQITSPDALDIDKISELIAQNCTLTRHDIVACLSAFQEQMINALMEGKSVRLKDLGSFRVTMHSVGAPSSDVFTVSNINRLSIRYVPSARLRKAISVGAPGISLVHVEHVEAAPLPPPAAASETGAPTTQANPLNPTV